MFRVGSIWIKCFLFIEWPNLKILWLSCRVTLSKAGPPLSFVSHVQAAANGLSTSTLLWCGHITLINITLTWGMEDKFSWLCLSLEGLRSQNEERSQIFKFISQVIEIARTSHLIPLHTPNAVLFDKYWQQQFRFFKASSSHQPSLLQTGIIVLLTPPSTLDNTIKGYPRSCFISMLSSQKHGRCLKDRIEMLTS